MARGCSTTARSTASTSTAAASNGVRSRTATRSSSGGTRCGSWTRRRSASRSARHPLRCRSSHSAGPRGAGRVAAPMAQTISVLSLKGGTGKTTTVRTLADVLRRLDLDVLAIDLDPQGNLSDYFDVPPDAAPTVADVLKGDAKISEATHDGIVPASPILAEVERSLSGKMGRELVLRKALKDARKSHDVILVDCPPA